MEESDVQIIKQLTKALTHLTSVVNQLTERVENAERVARVESGKVYKWN